MNPLPVLYSILGVAIGTMLICLVLVLTGNRQDVAILLGFAGPVLGSLFAVKQYLIHMDMASAARGSKARAIITNEKLAVIENQGNGERERMVQEMAAMRQEIKRLSQSRTP